MKGSEWMDSGGNVINFFKDLQPFGVYWHIGILLV